MNQHEGDNIGSVAKIEILEHFNFSTFYPAVPVEGATWIDIPFKEETGFIKIDRSENDQGVLHSYSGRFFLPRLRTEVDETLNPFIGKVAVMRVTDMNDEVYIIGWPGNPVLIELSATTGTNYPSENGAGYSYDIAQIRPHTSV